MAIDKSLINSFLDNLKVEVSKIQNMEVDLEQILEDGDIQDMVDRRMQVSIEICIDISSHLAAGLDLPRKERAADVFLLLGERKIISPEIAKKMAGAAGLRNLLVHEYAKIDYQLAYSDLDEKLKDLRIFGREVLDFVESSK